MDLTVEEYIENLFRDGNEDVPVYTKRPDELTYPPWYDEKKFQRARKFFSKNSFSMALTFLVGLIAVFAIPSILRVLVSTKRGNSTYTSYRRYLSTFLNAISWLEHDLKPGSVSWRSLQMVRNRHFNASMSSRKKGVGVISPRDIALTLFGFFGFAMVKPTGLGVKQFTPSDWEDYVHFWRIIGYMMGIDDRYNLCRKNADETRRVCQIVLERVFTPGLENVPEYFEHTTKVLMDAIETVVPILDAQATLYYTKYLADVPGYIMTETERMNFREKLLQKLDGKPIDTPIESSSLVQECAVKGLPKRAPKLLYVKDFDVLSEIPAYKSMKWVGKLKLNITHVLIYLCSTYLGRYFMNLVYIILHYLMVHFPFFAFFKFGVKQAYVNVFVEGPSDEYKPMTNEEFYKKYPCW